MMSDDWRKQFRRDLILHLGAFVAVVIVALLLNQMPLGLARSTMLEAVCMVIAAVSLNLVLGQTGQFSIGHAAFMTIGGYAGALLTRHTLAAIVGGPEALAALVTLERLESGDRVARYALAAWLWPLAPVLAGAICAALAGLLVGTPSLRLRGDYLAIVTLGFGEVVRNILQNSDPQTLGGASGLSNVPQVFSAAWILLLGVVSVFLLANLCRSTLGKAFLAIREDEIAAESVGINIARFKVQAFVIGAFFAGAAGAMLAHFHGGVYPTGAGWTLSVEVLAMVVLGGSGSVSGVVLAAILFTVLRDALRRVGELPGLPFTGEQIRMPVFALLLVTMMILRPRGLMGRWEFSDLYRYLRAKPPIPLNVLTDLAGGSQLARVSQPPRADPRPLSGEFVGPPDPLLVCENLQIRFGGLLAVDAFSLKLYPGELVGLIGPNGAGKTTVFNMLTGVYTPTSGRILFNGSDITSARPHRRNAAGMARTFQNIRLFNDLSVLDNVRIARHVHLRQHLLSCVLRLPAFYREEQQTIADSLRLLEILDLIDVAHETAASLPYGEQRRLEIARALATEPRLLLLDEPAAGMNPQEKVQLRGLIQRIQSQFALTILLIEHDMKVVMGLCERIVVLDHGQTIASGTPDAIRQHPAVIEAYLGEAPPTDPPAVS